MVFGRLYGGWTARNITHFSLDWPIESRVRVVNGQKYLAG